MIARAKNQKLGHVRVSQIAIRDIRPSPENDRLYRPVDPQDPEIITLSESIRYRGVLEPLVITKDGWILSGHRRYCAATLAGLKSVPCRIEPFDRPHDQDEVISMLVEYNRQQREKLFVEKMREELVSIDRDGAYSALLSERAEKTALSVPSLEIREYKSRSRITKAKGPFLQAIVNVLQDRRVFWPLSDRQIHYALLNAPPLIHASKPASLYANTLNAYKALTELLTRARLAGRIPWEAIADETRPVTTWGVHRDPRSFLREQLKDFFKGYWRDLQQSQPRHVELVVEKNTLRSIVEPVAGQFCIPVTSGRGFCSLPPRREMAMRFKASGKDKLVLLMVSDFDPDGEEIAHSFARSLRDDFGIEQIHPVKVALTVDQVKGLKLPPGGKAKSGSTNYQRFVHQYGADVFEVEAIPPAVLQEIVSEAIRSVLDIDAFNREVETEKADAAEIEAARKTAMKALGSFGAGNLDG